MVKRTLKASIIAEHVSNKGNRILAIWDYEPNHLPVLGHFTPLHKGDTPCNGDFYYLVIVEDNGYTTITPLDYPIQKGEND